MEMQVTNINRRSNGTADIDIYRRKAFLLRRETRNKILRRFGRSVRPLIGAVAILVSSVSLLLRNPMPQRAIPVFAPVKVSLLPDSLKPPKSDHRSQ